MFTLCNDMVSIEYASTEVDRSGADSYDSIAPFKSSLPL